MPDEKLVWLITGCSSGLGRALAEAVLAAGGLAIVTARNPESVADIVAAHPDTALPLALDVTDAASIAAAVGKALAWRGRIDVLVNNAGFGTIGTVEEIDEEEARVAFDANFYGVHRMLKAVLPHMRARRSGHILNVSSMLGFVGMAGYAFYSATKFAVEGLSEALAREVQPFGIKVTIVEPGPFRTDFRSRSLRMAPLHEDYRETLGTFRENLMKTDGTQPGDPARAGRLMVEMVASGEAPLRLPLGEVCIRQMRARMDAVRADIDHWEQRSIATAFES